MSIYVFLNKRKTNKKIFWCAYCATLGKLKEEINSHYTVLFGFSKKIAISSPVSAFITSFWNVYYRDKKIYTMQLFLRFSLPPENTLFNNLSSKLWHNFSQKLLGSICASMSLSQLVFSAHVMMGGGFSALLCGQNVAGNTHSKHCVNVRGSSWHLSEVGMD